MRLVHHLAAAFHAEHGDTQTMEEAVTAATGDMSTTTAAMHHHQPSVLHESHTGACDVDSALPVVTLLPRVAPSSRGVVNERQVETVLGVHSAGCVLSLDIGLDTPFTHVWRTLLTRSDVIVSVAGTSLHNVVFAKV